MEEQQAIEQFEKAKGVTKRNQKIFAYKQTYGFLVIRKAVQHNVTDKERDEVAEVWEKGLVIERYRIILKFKNK